ncbi:TIGR03943 family putative permease subunit [Streptomyces sp. NPDC060011]|uniref:TIGR03943 family putative permease subunit n=1 Tax=unclassified Streptomyces TaxID=2593676 RepID=UPI002252A791|nr:MULTISPECIES: TIGR03943 family protein [unclassified Streptomyces]MCX5137234.1 TIGR03943 family protein [Streptomyces sp. NBC_00340]WSD81388.1 TIGR03943 family protein [Streptomyces sp. NBC_01558]
MNRQAQAAVLFLVGAAVLHAGATDLYLRYVKAGLRPLLLAAGVVLIVTALATVGYEVRERRTASGTSGSAGGDGHAHPHREPRISWLLVLPLLALILVAPPALGSYSAMRTGTALQAPFGYPALPAGDPVPLGLVDYAGRAAYGHGHTLGDRRVRITGFVALDHAGTPYLVRMALNCCAADAQPVKIGLSGRIPPVLQPDAWLEVTGTYSGRRTKDPVNGGIIPFLDVSTARPVPAPRDPYDESWNN